MTKTCGAPFFPPFVHPNGALGPRRPLLGRAAAGAGDQSPGARGHRGLGGRGSESHPLVRAGVQGATHFEKSGTKTFVIFFEFDAPIICPVPPFLVCGG